MALEGDALGDGLNDGGEREREGLIKGRTS